MFLSPENKYRIGSGYDVHAFTSDRELILGGIKIDHDMGLAGHSDADVVLHAIMDALLGAVGLGDIGEHFPDNDDAYKGISSLKLLSHVHDMISERGYVVENMDITIICERPKIATYKEQMKKIIADELYIINADDINIKATTTEGLGSIGRGEGVACHAIVLLKK